MLIGIHQPDDKRVEHMEREAGQRLNKNIGNLALVEQVFFFFSSRRRHTRSDRDWSSDVCSSDLRQGLPAYIVFLISRAGKVKECPALTHLEDAGGICRLSQW